MQVEMPFYECAEDALKGCIQALGGAKVVGAQLFPDKSIEAAREYLLASLNPNRNEKLSYTQMMWVFSKAKEAGFHGGFQWFASEIGYDIKPITRAEEVDRLTSVIEQASKTLSTAVAALERVQNRVEMRSVK